ncbi:hypothetical protein SAMD00019534_100560 [Acytostelium subglobosum LB1]|uniref:hypothetical protein n=1 Tax=Acytostelium subglobosum LB1 TaxID=1410327 RepID=UPI0006451A74|nr:hypothetical protein SAMD00019534_100560 [Acytostelium subglobosum LB1]GAM26881.1 hypothetical protein SAMD00019534_100560 [Acytostelium subglobosum LB1]|eukprot:XP_012750149.1 hypothetical protein SAMD00019534_100560 [Acytostelium subglobosum LB1]
MVIGNNNANTNSNSNSNSNSNINNQTLRIAEEKEQKRLDQENEWHKRVDNGNGLIVLLIPHSHCDPGWLRTYNQYFEEKVHATLNNVIHTLENEKSKTFVWSEISYFRTWWDLQDSYTRIITRQLIRRGQLEIIGGGWVQNDEAVAQPNDVMDQITEGFQWLHRTLNITVDYGWQIDPFGHSSLTPTLMSKLNFKAVVGNRISETSKNYLIKKRQMQFMWEGSPSLGDSSQLFYHLMYQHYSYPDQYYNEDLSYLADPNVSADTIIDVIHNASLAYKTRVLFLPMGGDFAYSKYSEFKFNDDMLRIVQQRKYDVGIEDIRYGTIGEFFKLLNHELKERKVSIPLFNHDFFPYVAGPTQPWTGFYTSYTLFKVLVRDTSSLVHATDIMYSMALAKATSMGDDSVSKLQSLYPKLEESRRSVALTQHHDSVTGTSRADVMYNYTQYLNIATRDSYEVMSNSIEYLIHLSGETSEQSAYEYHNVLDLNLLLSSGVPDHSYSLVFVNPLSWRKNHHYSIRFTLDDHSMLDHIELISSKTLSLVPIQIAPIVPHDMPEMSHLANQYSLYFIVEVPAMGLNTYFIKIRRDGNKPATTAMSEVFVYKSERELSASNHRILSSKFLNVKFQANGMLSSITKTTNKEVIFVLTKETVNQYHSETSGNYIFTPQTKHAYKFNEHTRFYVVSGPLVKQLTIINYGVNVSDSMFVLHHRIYSNADKVSETPLVTEEIVDVGYSLIGQYFKETVINYETNLEGSNTIYTDNGLETRERKINNKMDINYQYFPVLHYANIKDRLSTKYQFTIFTERSHGVGSSSPGELEIMIHRTTCVDDEKGLLEPSNDLTRVDGRIYLSVDFREKITTKLKEWSLQLTTPPRMMAKYLKIDHRQYLMEHQSSMSFLKEDLPPNVHIYSLKSYNDLRNGEQAILNMRIGHLFSAGQTFKQVKHLSDPVMLSKHSIFNSMEYVMNYNQQTNLAFLPIRFDLVEHNKQHYKVAGVVDIPWSTGTAEFGANRGGIGHSSADDNGKGAIRLSPMDIKSYQLTLKYAPQGSFGKLKYQVVELPSGTIIKYSHDFSTHKISEIPNR